MPVTECSIDSIVTLIKTVQPGLQDVQITSEQSVVDDLGLDSLDLLQLSRRISRELGVDFDLDSWNADADSHHRSVGSIVDQVRAAGD
jgi:acyl carrier protein